jgi:thiol-disulfide isomerase/thioredoxin/sugar lactone lactonase YvrE
MRERRDALPIAVECDAGAIGEEERRVAMLETMPKLTMAAVLAAALILGAASPAFAGGEPVADKQMEGAVRAPDFPAGLQWLNTDHPISLAQLRGKFVLLDFWTFCCINCMHVIPQLERLEKKYADELVVVGVHSAKFPNEQSTAAIRQAILRYGLKHPVVNDKDFKVWNEYGARAWPTLVLINPAGRIVGQVAGEDAYGPIDAALSRGIPYFEAKGELVKGPLTFAPEAARSQPTLLRFPGKISSDEKGGRLFISDSDHDRVLVTDGAGKILDVIGSGSPGFSDGSFEDATLRDPQGTVFAGGLLYIADTGNHAIRAADLQGRTVRTLWGTGEQAGFGTQGGRGTAAALNSPWDLSWAKGRLFAAMAGAHQVWAADPETGAIAPWAGSGREARVDGSLSEAALAQPSGITTDGSSLYTADSESSSIRKISLDLRGKVETILGEDLFVFGDADGSRRSARLQHPLGVAFHGGKVYVADTYNCKIKIVDPAKRTSETLAGTGKHGAADGPFASASFDEPGGLCFLNDLLFVADTNNHSVRVLDLKTGTVRTLQLSGLEKVARRQMEDFRGRVVKLPEQAVAAGVVKVEVGLGLPRGAKLSAEAPAFLAFRTGDPAVASFSPLGPLDLKPDALPLALELKASAGRTEAFFDAVVYFCKEGSGACYVDQVRLTLPLAVTPRGTAGFQVTIPVQ